MIAATSRDRPTSRSKHHSLKDISVRTLVEGARILEHFPLGAGPHPASYPHARPYTGQKAEKSIIYTLYNQHPAGRRLLRAVHYEYLA